ncbi:MAG: insulinase family protein [bacterium]|nr:insulinase family protein [bacterium]
MTQSEYRRTVLENGIRVVSESMPYLKSASIGIWVDVGSRNEMPRENGISHFIEHMCFKGTEKRTAKEIAQSLEILGGSLNAFTSRENTCYYCRVIDENFDTGFDVLADLLTNSLFDPAELEREKEVICEEIKDVFDTPAELVHDYFADAMWKPHPLGQTIMGDAEGIRKLTRTDVLDYIRRNYTTDRVVVAGAGAIDHDHFVALTREKLKIGQPSEPENLSAPEYGAGKRIVHNRDLNQTHICLGFPSISFADKNKYAMLILNTLLGSGMGSRLFQSVREERGLVYTIYSYQDFYKDTGLFGIYLGTDTAKAKEALNVILGELAKVKSNSVTELEVANTKSQLKGNLLLSLEGSYNRMNRLARHELFANQFVTLEQTAAEIDAVQLEDVRAMAQKIFDEASLTMVTLGSAKKTLIKQVDWSVLRG